MWPDIEKWPQYQNTFSKSKQQVHQQEPGDSASVMVDDHRSIAASLSDISTKCETINEISPDTDRKCSQSSAGSSTPLAARPPSSTAVASAIESVHPSPVPDGGWLAYFQVLGCFMVIFLTWGYINAFGFFQTYYASQSWVSASPSSIAWIGTIQIFLLLFVGAYSGCASDAGYFRWTTLTGCSLIILGIFMTSICSSFWQLLLAHGVCTGLGNGLVFTPATSVMSTYFSPKKKSLMIGVALCGAAVGGMVIPTILEDLIPKVGFGWTMRIFGFVAVAILAVSEALLRKRLPPKEGGRILDFEALKDVLFVLFVIGYFLNFLGLYFAFLFIGAYARDVLGLSLAVSINMLLVINGSGIPGRLLPLWLADQRHIKGVQPITVTIPINFMTAVLLFAWIGVRTQNSLYVFAALYGFMGNGLQCLFPASLANMALDPRETGAQMGWGFTICSFSMLIGNPIGGLLIQAGSGSYLYAQLFAGICIMSGCFVITTVAKLRTRQKAKIAEQFEA